MAELRAPDSFEGAAAVLAAAAAERQRVRIIGAGTKRGWGTHLDADADVELSTRGLSRLYRHNAGDFTAVIGAGVPLDALQQQLATDGQMLALDPPLGPSATVGGIFATGDSGPLRHRFGAPRDQILGVTVALADGSVARSGANVIRNAAGYDLARLFCASFGTLGVILTVTVRLQPVPDRTATALALTDDPVKLAAAASALAASTLELRALDIAWRGGQGGLLAQAAGHAARRRAGRAASAMGSAGLTGVEVTEQDAALWERQRMGQRSSERALVRIGTRPSQLPELLAVTDRCAGTLVGRATAGVSYLELDPARVGELRMALPTGAHAELLDRPVAGGTGASAGGGAGQGGGAGNSSGSRGSGDPWGVTDASALALMRAVKDRFDPAGVCNRGIYVGGI